MITETATDAGLSWMPAEVWSARGLDRHGPHTDFGTRRGPDRDIRVRYAGYPDPARAGRGLLFAHHPSSDRYALLHPDTTLTEVRAAWQAIPVRERDSGDPAHLVSVIDAAGPDTAAERARRSLLRCLRHEFASREALATSGPGMRADLTLTCVIARTARMAAEDRLGSLVRRDVDIEEAIVLDYRIDGRPPITGVLTAPDADTASATHRHLDRLARAFGASLGVTGIGSDPAYSPTDDQQPDTQPRVCHRSSPDL